MELFKTFPKICQNPNSLNLMDTINNIKCIESEMSPDKLNSLCSYVACDVRTEQCDLGIMMCITYL